MGRIDELAFQKVRSGVDGLQRTTKIMPQDGDELLTQFTRGTFVEQRGVLLFLAKLAVELRGNQRRKSVEHRYDARLRQFRRVRVKRTQIAKIAAVGEDDRHGNVALDLIKLRHAMGAIVRIDAGVLDNDGSARRPRFKAQRRVDIELFPGFHAQVRLILYRTGRPACVGDPCDDGKSHAGGFAQHGQ